MKIYRGNIKLCQGTTDRNERIKKENPKSNCINVNKMSQNEKNYTATTSTQEVNELKATAVNIKS